MEKRITTIGEDPHHFRPLYEEAIFKAFKDPLVYKIDNINDISWGYDISPKPGVMIRIEVDLLNDYKVKITSFTIKTWGDEELLIRKIYSGDLPTLPDRKPDTGFIFQLLSNYKNIG